MQETPTTRLIEGNRRRAAERQSQVRHDEGVNSNSAVSETIINVAESIVKYLEHKTTRVEITNHLKSIGTPDALKVIPVLRELQRTLATHKNTDLTEITAVMKQVLDEAKLIPKEHPDFPESHKPIDHTAQFESLEETLKAVGKLIEDKDMVVEAPVVKLPAPIVHVDAPDMTPVQTGLRDVVKAVGGIVIPEFKTDNAKVEELLKGANKLLKDLLEKPISSGGSGGGSTWIATNSDGIPMPIGVDAHGSIATTSPITKKLIDDTTTANVTYIGDAPPGTATSAAAWRIRKIDETSGVAFTWAGLDFDAIWDNRAGLSYS